MYLENKYTAWYYNIINYAKLRTLSPDVYTEKHHIIPRSMGGDNNADNLVKLTAREHFVCHLLLVKMVPSSFIHKMQSAVTRFKQATSYQRRFFTSWEYKKIREYAIKARMGIRHTDEARKKIRDKHHNVSGSNNPRAKFIELTSPTGEKYILHGELKKFCKDNNIAYSSMSQLVKLGKNRTGSTEGWKSRYL